MEVSRRDDYEFKKRVKLLYPAVDEEETPLPSKWNSNDKYTFIGLSDGDLKVLYKGLGKTHRDAASVRADYPIPTGCGIYYFEAKIVSKGRDGYMGIGLSSKNVNLNRLPGWDKQSYGYHGDDGHSFCSSGTGLPYGPTFTTGDVIGCCVNLTERTCFYTKNGINIGIAFNDLPDIPLYPMVGLQTPKEEVYANFGQHPFAFDIQDYIEQWKMKTRNSIENHQVPNDSGEFQLALHRLVSTYLIHHGYAATAEAFGKKADLTLGGYTEDFSSIQNRQRIQKLVLDGHISEGIDLTNELFPQLLQQNKNLLFMLKVRQFIEMINGTVSEVKNKTEVYNGLDPSFLQSPKSCQANASTSCVTSVESKKPEISNGSSLESDSEMDTDMDEQVNGAFGITNGSNNCTGPSTSISSPNFIESQEPGGQISNGSVISAGDSAILRVLSFGKHLMQLCQNLKEDEPNFNCKRMLEDAFSLLAYSNPWNSPVRKQLDPVQREPVCAALNSAILDSQNLPKTPLLLIAVSHAHQCIKRMALNNIGTSAFASVYDYLI